MISPDKNTETGSLSVSQCQQIIHYLQQHIPGLLAVYLFGSQARGQATEQSDLDLAVYHDGELDVVSLWELASELADQLDTDIDLVDFNRASTVFQYQILQDNCRLWSKDYRADNYEATVLNMKTTLDEWRSDILADIHQSGQVYSGD